MLLQANSEADPSQFTPTLILKLKPVLPLPLKSTALCCSSTASSDLLRPPQMPRITSPLLPSDHPYSKSEKTKKPFHSHSHTHLPRSPLSLFLISLICLSIGIVFTIFSLYSLSSRTTLASSIRCGRVQDTFRSHYSASSIPSRKLGGGGGPGGAVADRPKLLGFVGVQTAFSSADRRDAVRSTWFPSDPDALLRLERATGLAFRFVIGHSKDKKKMAELEKEVDKYKDFILINVDEEYAKLPYKTLEFFKAAFELFEADYYVKADDDIYLRPDRLATLLAKERTSSMTYIGCMKKGPVITDPKMKWYESQGHLIGNEYFLHAYGPMYILSAEVVASLATAKNNSLRMFSNEDVTIGSWMLSLNVHHEDNRAICDPRCTPTSIGVWDIPKCSGLCNPATRLKELHQISMCSKSPTLPPDDDDDR